MTAAKARGVKLGSARPGHWKGREAERLAGLAKAREASAKARAAEADDAYSDLTPVMIELKTAGKSLRSIAEALNAEGHTTRSGKPWNQVQVKRVLERMH